MFQLKTKSYQPNLWNQRHFFRTNSFLSSSNKNTNKQNMRGKKKNCTGGTRVLNRLLQNGRNTIARSIEILINWLRYRTFVVCFFVFFWQTHVSFCVSGIIQCPCSDRCSWYSNLKCFNGLKILILFFFNHTVVIY